MKNDNHEFYGSEIKGANILYSKIVVKGTPRPKAH